MEGYVSQYRSRPNTYLPLEFSRQPSIVIMGDGYTTADFGQFEATAKKMVDDLFSVSPFSQEPFCNYFNIFFVYLNSEVRGIGVGKPKNTPLRCYFHPDYPETIVFDDVNFLGGRKAASPFDVAEQFVPGINLNNTVVVVLVNSTQTGYTTGCLDVAPYGKWISIISDNSDPVEFKRMVLREVGGKGFARLSEEDGYFSADFRKMITDRYTKYGFYANVDVTSNPALVRWSRFLSYDVIYPELGIFSAGNGVTRPDNDNVMLVRGALRYDAPSREAIIKRIFQIHEWDYNDLAFIHYFVDNPI